MHAYQIGVDRQLFVWIHQQKNVSNVSLQNSEKKTSSSQLLSLKHQID